MDLVFRGIILFFAVFVLLRVIDRRELAEMEPFDFILLIVLGDAIQQGLTQDDYSVTGALITVGTLAGLQTLIGWLAFRFKPARRLLEGAPVVLIENGNVLERNLRRSHIGIEDLAEEARLAQLRSLDEIDWAVLETSGKVSIISKSG
jgi:uncharacterized membrane protein YcaP (DUF421 family)